MATSLTLENDSSLAQGYLKVNGSTAATLTTSGITGNLTGNVTGNLNGSLTAGGSLTFATEQTASGTSDDFTGIPSWVKRITVMFNGVSINGNSNIRILLGTGGVPATTGYFSSSSSIGAGAVSLSSISGFDIYGGLATFVFSGSIFFNNISGNIWICNGVLGYDAGATGTLTLGGKVALSGVLNMLRITTSNGTDTFDAGTINISYEG